MVQNDYRPYRPYQADGRAWCPKVVFLRFFGNSFVQAPVQVADMAIGQNFLFPRSAFTHLFYQKTFHGRTTIIHWQLGVGCVCGGGGIFWDPPLQILNAISFKNREKRSNLFFVSKLYILLLSFGFFEFS